MDFILSDLNYLAILVAVIVNQAIGASWYSMKFFGKTWAAEADLNVSEIDKKEASRGLLFGTLLAIFIYILLAILLEMLNANSWYTGFQAGLLLGVLVSLQSAIHYIYEGRSRKLFLINASFNIISYTIGGLIIGSW